MPSNISHVLHLPPGSKMKVALMPTAGTDQCSKLDSCLTTDWNRGCREKTSACQAESSLLCLWDKVSSVQVLTGQTSFPTAHHRMVQLSMQLKPVNTTSDITVCPITEYSTRIDTLERSSAELKINNSSFLCHEYIFETLFPPETKELFIFSCVGLHTLFKYYETDSQLILL